jgi:tryptophan synthase alpha subunit
VTIKEILSNPFWRYLGIREAEEVKKVFKEADANGVIAKYIVADQLEQVTTRYSFEEFIQRRLQL